MNCRLIAILSIVCLALAEGGCASKTWSHKQPKHKPEKHSQAGHSQVVLLPAQTGSNLNRRIVVDDESSLKPMIQPESKPPAKKHVMTERTKAKRAEAEKPEKPEKRKRPQEPEEPSTEPDRFR